ncbi:MAG: hypothetical protein BWY77_00043 [bacterium ADurb.Bin431]|nr:MAG: hypothetical protein BWY77_00043 [bacterium ADurb.Bin431]
MVRHPGIPLIAQGRRVFLRSVGVGQPDCPVHLDQRFGRDGTHCGSAAGGIPPGGGAEELVDGHLFEGAFRTSKYGNLYGGSEEIAGGVGDRRPDMQLICRVDLQGFGGLDRKNRTAAGRDMGPHRLHRLSCAGQQEGRVSNGGRGDALVEEQIDHPLDRQQVLRGGIKGEQFGSADIPGVGRKLDLENPARNAVGVAVQGRAVDIGGRFAECEGIRGAEAQRLGRFQGEQGIAFTPAHPVDEDGGIEG